MNAEAWKKHFVDMATGKLRQKTFYQLGTQRGGGDEAVIQLVTPTQQGIEMARSQEKDIIKTEKKKSAQLKKRKLN